MDSYQWVHQCRYGPQEQAILERPGQNLCLSWIADCSHVRENLISAGQGHFIAAIRGELQHDI